MSQTVAIAALTTPPTKAHVYLPLQAAVDLLEATLPADSPSSAREVLARARAALAVLADLIPPAEDVLDDFLSVFGPLESKFSRAQNEAWRESAHDSKLTDSLCSEALCQIRELLIALAPTTQTAEAAYAQVELQTSVLKQALDEAQKDGWGRGDYVSPVREALVGQFVEVVTTAARGIMTS